MLLTENFHSDEFLISRENPVAAKKLNLSEVELSRLQLLCDSVLQTIRYRFGETIILSGKRNTILNSIVGGAKDSDHLYSIAADFYQPGIDPKEVYAWIKEKQLPYRQLILYKNSIHCSINIPGRVYKHETIKGD